MRVWFVLVVSGFVLLAFSLPAVLPPPVAVPRKLTGDPPAEGVAPSRVRALTAPSAWGATVMPFLPEHVDAERRTASLEARSARRAFEGAPPPMRHSDQFVRGSLECLDCHRQGMWLGKRLARPMSHLELSNCQQCHVQAVNNDFVERAQLPANGFEGLTARIPPSIPHVIELREDCVLCHEPRGVAHEPEPEPQHPGHPGWLPPVPPAMPHGTGDEARRDCSTCHVQAADPSVDVGHPLGRPRFAECLTCHRGDAHEPFGAPRIAPGQIGVLGLPSTSDSLAREDCRGCHVFATASGAIAHAVAELPPRIPHGTLLRTRCISCHGEYGYDGLRIDHGQRGQCIQCHLPMDGIDRRPPTTFR